MSVSHELGISCACVAKSSDYFFKKPETQIFIVKFSTSLVLFEIITLTFFKKKGIKAIWLPKTRFSHPYFIASHALQFLVDNLL